MNQTIWKYGLHTYANKLTTPKGARLLSVDWQGEKLCIWALVDSDQREEEARLILVLETGGPVRAFPEPLLSRDNFIGTASRPGYVVHVFDCGFEP
jgi:hypothetical protein